MRGGRHFVEFAITHEQDRPQICLGVIRPVSLTIGIDLKADWKGIVDPMFVPSAYDPVISEKLRSQRTAKWGGSNIHCCAYYCYNGYCFWADWDNEKGRSEWQGREELGGSGTVGLLLDLNKGTLSVFKNGRRLGVMKDGLGGEYAWFVSVCPACTIGMPKAQLPIKVLFSFPYC